MAPSPILQIFLRVTVRNQVRISQRVIVDEVVQFRPLRHGHVQFILDPGAVNGNVKQKRQWTVCLPVDIPTGWEPRRNLVVRALRVAFADFSAAPWQGFEKSERGPNNSSLFQPLAAVVVVALGCLLPRLRRGRAVRVPSIAPRKTSTHCVLVFLFCLRDGRGSNRAAARSAVSNQPSATTTTAACG